MNRASNQLALIKSEKPVSNENETRVFDAHPPGCDWCDEPIAGRVYVETEDETYEPQDLCQRHVDHVLMYFATQRYSKIA